MDITTATGEQSVFTYRSIFGAGEPQMSLGLDISATLSIALSVSGLSRGTKQPSIGYERRRFQTLAKLLARGKCLRRLMRY